MRHVLIRDYSIELASLEKRIVRARSLERVCRVCNLLPERVLGMGQE